ncbi:MAG: type II secretion system protein [Candidatus Pacebacteria bacterium]|nr:type II secretion system protein [Candidatus Paceibacterota bacterium]
MKRVKSGFTLVEVLVFAAATSIFILLTFGTLTSFLRSRNRTKKLSQLQETNAYIFNELTQEIHWSSELDSDSLPNELKLVQTQDEEAAIETEIIFRIDSQNRFLKNDAPISSPQVKVTDFQVANRAAAGNIPCVSIYLRLEYPDLRQDLILENRTTISFRKTKFKTT